MESYVFSILRIISTLMIFVFHFNGIYGVGGDAAPILLLSLPLFIFISGYFSARTSSSPLRWLFRRITRIYVPYLVVMMIVIASNLVTRYKPMDFWSVLLSLAGGTLFASSKLYVISWFVTYILLCYLFYYLYMVVPNLWLKLGLIAAYLLLNQRLGLFPTYPAAFLLGIAGGSLNLFRNAPAPGRSSSATLFAIQNLSYHFFLLHGGVLLLTRHVLHLEPAAGFAFAFATTTIATVPFKMLTDKLEAAVLTRFPRAPETA